MPDLREVFEMVKQQTEPDLDSWSEQERRMRQAARRRKTGALALVAAIIVALVVLVVKNADDPGSSPATNPSPASPPPIFGLALVDIPTGAMTGTGIVPAGSAVDASPDGTQITYAANNGGSSGVVWVANVDGTNQRAFNSTDGAATPRWSPDGTKIVYQGYQNENQDNERIGNLYVLDVATGKRTRITDLPQGPTALYHGLDALAPTFSADGASVLFAMSDDLAGVSDGAHPGWDIWSVPATGGEPSLEIGDAFGPDVQPDGSIAFSTVSYDKSGPAFGSLAIADADGRTLREIVKGETMLPRWSPDGTQIAYLDLRHESVTVVDATGGTQKILEGADGWPEWVNQETLIVDNGG
jgi:Tol biopolymer transport system component